MTPAEESVHGDALCFMGETWAVHKDHRNSVEQWLALGNSWRLVVGGGWGRLVVGGWQLGAVGGWGRLVVGG